MPAPLTTIFENRSKVTRYFIEQNVLICSLVPGSWAPNSLAGKATTANPRPAYFSCSFCSPSYCGVRPHSEAVLTSSMTFPLYEASGLSLPSMVLSVN